MSLISEAQMEKHNQAVAVYTRLYAVNEELKQEIIRVQKDTEELKALEQRVLASTAALLGESNLGIKPADLSKLESVKKETVAILTTHVGEQNKHGAELDAQELKLRQENEARAREIQQLANAVASMRV